MHFFAFASIIDYVLYVVKDFMKKVFIPIRQWILEHKKKLIYGMLAFFISQFCFFSIGEFWIENQVFAEDASQENTIESKIKEKCDTLWLVQKIIYVLIHPMLVVAGTLVDNSMVYWQAFGFDVVLRELWNIMRNLANYTLWFIFIYKIFKYLIDQKSWGIKKLLISSLIAWIGIQASWFVMAALIDLSTILTYGIWWLPITVLGDKGIWWNESQWACSDKDSKFKYDPYVYKTLITVDVDKPDRSAIKHYLTNTSWNNHFYISECASFRLTWSREILLGPSVIYYEESKTVFKSTATGLCHFAGQVYQFKNVMINRPDCKNETGCDEAQTTYTTEINDKITALQATGADNLKPLIENGTLLEEWNAHVTWGVQRGLRTGQYPICEMWLDVDNVSVWSGQTQRLHETLDSKSYVWVFTLLYGSLIRSGESMMWKTGNSWFLNLLSIALELWHLIAIAIPLIVVAILFMARIGILWVAIIISPFIAIFTAFEDDIGKFVFDKIQDLKYFKLTTLLWIIFSPAIICLAICLSTVFVTIISNVNVSESMWEERQNILWWMIQINIAKVTAGIWQFFKAFLWAAITWYILWAAIQSSKLWEMKFVDTLKKLAEKSIWTIPIVPVPTKDWKIDFIWANKAFGLNNTSSIISDISSEVENMYRAQENSAVNDLFGKWMSEEDAAKLRLKTYTDKILKDKVEQGWESKPIEIWEKWSKKQVMMFNELNADDKKSVIDEINKSSEGTRRAFGSASPQLDTGGGNRYKFRETAKNRKGEVVKLYKYMTDDEFNKEYTNP